MPSFALSLEVDMERNRLCALVLTSWTVPAIVCFSYSRAVLALVFSKLSLSLIYHVPTEVLKADESLEPHVPSEDICLMNGPSLCPCWADPPGPRNPSPRPAPRTTLGWDQTIVSLTIKARPSKKSVIIIICTVQMVKMLTAYEPAPLNGPFIYVMWTRSSSIMTALSSDGSIRALLTHCNETQTAWGEGLSDVMAGPADAKACLWGSGLMSWCCQLDLVSGF